MLYFGFQKLEIYQLSKEMVKDIYKGLLKNSLLTLNQ